MKPKRLDLVSEEGSEYSFVTVYDKSGNELRTEVYRNNEKLRLAVYVSEINMDSLFREYDSKEKASKKNPVSLSDLEEWLLDWKELPLKTGRVCRFEIKDNRAVLTASSRINPGEIHLEENSLDSTSDTSTNLAQV